MYVNIKQLICPCMIEKRYYCELSFIERHCPNYTTMLEICLHCNWNIRFCVIGRLKITCMNLVSLNAYFML